MWIKSGAIGSPANHNDPRLNFTWDESVMQDLFEEQVANEITSIPLPMKNEVDRLIRTGTKSREFSVKNGYNQLREVEATTKAFSQQASSSYRVPKVLWSKIWTLHVSPKLCMFLWNLC